MSHNTREVYIYDMETVMQLILMQFFYNYIQDDINEL